MRKYFRCLWLLSSIFFSFGCLLPVSAIAQCIVEGIGNNLANPIFVPPVYADWTTYNFLRSHYPVFAPPNFTQEHWNLIKQLAEADGVLTDRINGQNCVWLQRNMDCHTMVPKDANHPAFLPALREDGFPINNYNRMLTVYKLPNDANYDCLTNYEHEAWLRKQKGDPPLNHHIIPREAGLRVTSLEKFIRRLPNNGQALFDPGIRDGSGLTKGELCDKDGNFTPSIMFTDRTISKNCPTAGNVSSVLSKVRLQAYLKQAPYSACQLVQNNILTSPDAVGSIVGQTAHALGAPDWAAEGAGVAGATGSLGYYGYMAAGGPATGLSYGRWLMLAGSTAGSSALSNGRVLMSGARTVGSSGVRLLFTPVGAGVAAVGAWTFVGVGAYRMGAHSPSKGYSPDGGWSEGYCANFADLYLNW